MAIVNQTRPHCVNQTGKTHSKLLAARHGRGTAWARHAMCESALTLPLPLGTLAQSRKAPVSFVVSVCPSDRTDFLEIDGGGFCQNLSRRSKYASAGTGTPGTLHDHRSTFDCCQRLEFAIRQYQLLEVWASCNGHLDWCVSVATLSVFVLLPGHMATLFMSTTLRTHCCVSLATVVTRTRHNVTLYVHRLFQVSSTTLSVNKAVFCNW